MKNRILSSVCFTVVLCASIACGTSECLDNQNSRPNAVFLASGGERNGQTIRVDSLTITGVDSPDNSPLIANGSISNITLPFRLGETQTTYRFSYGGELRGYEDVIKFSYKPVPEFVSAECGAIYAFEDVEVSYTTLLIDSVVCPWSTINNVERNYVQIYFRVEDE